MYNFNGSKRKRQLIALISLVVIAAMVVTTLVSDVKIGQDLYTAQSTIALGMTAPISLGSGPLLINDADLWVAALEKVIVYVKIQDNAKIILKEEYEEDNKVRNGCSSTFLCGGTRFSYTGSDGSRGDYH